MPGMLLVGRHSTDSIRVSYFDQRDGYQYFPLLELSPPHGEFELTALLDGDAFDAGPGPTYLLTFCWIFYLRNLMSRPYP
jgi:hypothetical protein